MKRSVISFLYLCFVLSLSAKTKDFDLNHWPNGKSPLEIGTRIAYKFLATPHSRYGSTHPDTPPTQITYPNVCTCSEEFGLPTLPITSSYSAVSRINSVHRPEAKTYEAAARKGWLA